MTSAMKLIQTILTLSIVILVSSCAVAPPYEMNESTAEHPATQRFIDFANDAAASESYNALLPEYYTPATQKKIAGLKGWYKLSYSSAHQFFRSGSCNRIVLKPKGLNRAQIDCFGEMTISSMIIADRTEESHLRVFMVKKNDAWFIDTAGYIHRQTASTPHTFGRAGIKFSSLLEKTNPAL